MGNVHVKVPSMGEGIYEVTIIRWLVKTGDQVEPDTPLVEIATDKVDSEIGSPQKGIVKKIFRFEGDMPRVGETIVLLSVEGEESSEEEVPISTENISAIIESSETDPAYYSTSHPEKVFSPDALPNPEEESHPYLSPFIQMASREMGITAEELSAIRGSATGNRITKRDFFQYLQVRLKTREMISSSNQIPANEKQEFAIPEHSENSDVTVERIKMDRVRKLISEHMVRSKQTAPHVTSFYEADLTTLVQWRNDHKEEFLRKFGSKLTFTPLFTEAVALAVKKFPRINVSLEEDYILVKKEINIGIATALPDGNLIVPVIKQADSLHLGSLATKIEDLVLRAREKRLSPGEITGGTFTITNLGMFNSLTGTPVINQPESAILAIGSILRKPAVVQGSFGESIGIRDICILSLSYDHRIIDGSLGGQFLKEVANLLENPDHSNSL